MVNIRSYVALSMISIPLGIMKYCSGETQQDSGSDINAPRKIDYCSGIICQYSVVFGNTSATLELYHKRYQSEEEEIIPFHTFVEYDPTDPKFEPIVSFILVTELKHGRTPRIFEDTIKIVRGGIGAKFVTLEIESYGKTPLDYRIGVFAHRLKPIERPEDNGPIVKNRCGNDLV